jgi:tRNA pseudouridine55 synthase
MNGLVLIDKPSGCTSHDVVAKWRRLARTKRTGHLGTLDPMATGLLILVTGNATRLAQFFNKDEKTYEATIQFGLTSDTYDAEGDVVSTGIPVPKDVEAITAALAPFRGHIMQTPPPVSAKKINGVPAYKLARQHIEVELKPVEVHIKEIQTHAYADGTLTLRVTCSTGTYIRSIAHDLGRDLGCGAVLTSLRRTFVGDYSVADAFTLPRLAELADLGLLDSAVTPTSRMLPAIPTEYFDESIEAQIRQGRDFRTSPFVVPPGAPLVKAVSRKGDLIAIGQLKIPNLYHPGTVL